MNMQHCRRLSAKRLGMKCIVGRPHLPMQCTPSVQLFKNSSVFHVQLLHHISRCLLFSGERNLWYGCAPMPVWPSSYLERKSLSTWTIIDSIATSDASRFDSSLDVKHHRYVDSNAYIVLCYALHWQGRAPSAAWHHETITHRICWNLNA